MILFCNFYVVYFIIIFAGSKSTKNKFNGSLIFPCCAFITFRTVCSSSNSSNFISSVLVELCGYLMTIL